jgi:hypothetical protein
MGTKTFAMLLIEGRLMEAEMAPGWGSICYPKAVVAVERATMAPNKAARVFIFINKID